MFVFVTIEQESRSKVSLCGFPLCAFQNITRLWAINERERESPDGCTSVGNVAIYWIKRLFSIMTSIELRDNNRETRKLGFEPKANACSVNNLLLG